jgi:transposase
MPAERTAMREVREVLRLKFVGGVPTREIARRLGVAASTVRATLRRFAAAGLNWPLPEEMTDAVLEARLFSNAGTKQGHRRLVEPDWAAIQRELKRKHVTLQILWDEYIEREPQGYRYSRFCELYRSWEAKLPVTMRQTHVGGDKLFVDYAGDTVPVIIDRLTGEIRRAQIFVAVMGASNFTYVEATWAPTRTPLPRSAASRASSFPTTPRSPSSRRASTSRRSTAPMPRWRPITAPPCCRHGHGARATRPRSKAAC